MNENDAVEVRATDRGTGVASIELRDTYGGQLYQGEGTGEGDLAAPSCPATGDVLCRFEAGQAFSVSTLTAGSLRQGRRAFTVLARDGGGIPWSTLPVVGIDTTAPDVSLSGALYAQRDNEIPAGVLRPLTVDAEDGYPGNQRPLNRRSGVGRIEIYVDDELVKEEEQTDSEDNAPLSTTWTPEADTFTEGDYTVRVITADRAGHENEREFTVHAPCCGVPLEDATVPVGDRLNELGDVDGDGKADAVLVDKLSGAITVRLGNGDGTFAPEQSWGTFGEAVDQIAVGDVDGESPDLPDWASAAIAGDDVVAQTTSGALLVRLSDGASFSTPATSGMADLQTTWPAGRSLGLADVDGDGSADLWGVDAVGRQLRVGYSRGKAFDTSTAWATVPASRDVEMADLDGDGLADLVTYEPSDGVVRFHQSDGESLAATDTWGQGPQNSDLATGDVNGDGLDDAVFRATGPGGADPAPVTVRLSSRNEGFVAGSRTLGALAASYTLHASVDLTGDGRADLVGTRLLGTDLLVRSVASVVPNIDEPDPTPVDPDQVDADPVAARTTAARGPRRAALMMSDDDGLRYGKGLADAGDGGRNALLDRMKDLGATKVRTIAYWGKIDRLHPTDESGLLLAAGEPVDAPLGADGAAQSKTNPPISARRFALARDVNEPVDLTGTVDDPSAEWIGGEWRTVKNRFYVSDVDRALGLVAGKGMRAHVTVTGGTGGFTECKAQPGEEDVVRATLRVRGCRAGQPATGDNPDPERAGHAIASITQYLRGAHGSTLESVGVWNEPNLLGRTFLYRSGLDTAALYGRIYAYAWEEMRRRGMLSGGSRVKIAFGELTSAKVVNKAEKTKQRLRTRWPDTWATDALAAAKAAPGVQWPGSGQVRADIFAIHPYQHTGAPWDKSKKYPWGVNGVGRPFGQMKGRKTPVPSVKGFLDSASDAKLRKQAASGKTAPEIWATEFAYFNVKGTKGRLSWKGISLHQGHSEVERTRFMTYDGAKGKGALPGLSQQGNVKVIGLWNVVEDPMEQIGPAAGNVLDDYGFIGAAKLYGGPTAPDGGASYTTLWPGWTPASRTYENQALKVTGARVYGKAPKKRPAKAGSSAASKLGYKRFDGLQWPQYRKLGCAIRVWHGTAKGAPC